MPTSKHTRSPASLSTPTTASGAVEKETAPIVPTIFGSADAGLLHRGASDSLRPAEVLPFRADASYYFGPSLYVAHVELAAGAIWGRRVDQHVPALQARVTARKAAAQIAPPTA